MGFKVLVSVACVAIIAFVGTFFWERYDTHQRQEEAREFARCDDKREQAALMAAGTPRRNGDPAVVLEADISYCDRRGY